MIPRALPRIALLLALVTLGIWLGTGAHLGWTKTRVTVMRVDPITELDYPETRDRLVVGVELLTAGLFGAALLAGGGWWWARRGAKKPASDP